MTMENWILKRREGLTGKYAKRLAIKHMLKGLFQEIGCRSRINETIQGMEV